MENITLGQVSLALTFIIGLISGIGFLMQNTKKWINNAMKEQMSDIKVQMGDITDRLDQVDLESTKNYLVTYLIDELEKSIDEIEHGILLIKDNLETLLISLNNLTLNLDNLLNAELKNNINKSVNNLASSMNNIKDISSDLKLLVDSENGKLTMVVNNLETMTNNFTAVGDSLKNIDYNRVINTLEECATEFNTLIRNINEGQGSAGLLINEDSLYNNINQTIESLQSLIDEIKANPKKIKLSVF